MIQYKFFVNLCYSLLPKCIKQKIHDKQEDKKIARQLEVLKTKISKEEIDAVFDKLNLDCDVIVHSSLTDLGRIEGNLKPIVNRLEKDVISKGHTVLCPAIPVKGSTLDYLKSIKEFDAETAPNAMGVISKYYQKLEPSKRSLSPTHSVVACGKDSGAYTDSHHLDVTPFAEHSPYMKLVLSKGKVLLFGAQWKSLTICHVVEDMLGDDYPVKVYNRKPVRLKVRRGGEIVYDGLYKAHNKWCGLSRGLNVNFHFRDLESTKIIPLGCGNVSLLDARDITLRQLEYLKKGMTLYGHRRISDNCLKKTEEWITRLNSL